MESGGKAATKFELPFKKDFIVSRFFEVGGIIVNKCSCRLYRDDDYLLVVQKHTVHAKRHQ